MRFERDHPKEARFDPEFGKGGGGGGRSTASTEEADRTSEAAHETMRTVSRHQLIYSMTGLAVAVVLTLLGCLLFLAGITDDTQWTVNTLGLESELNDAAPGAVLFVAGLVIGVITRYSFQVRR